MNSRFPKKKGYFPSQFQQLIVTKGSFHQTFCDVTLSKYVLKDGKYSFFNLKSSEKCSYAKGSMFVDTSFRIYMAYD